MVSGLIQGSFVSNGEDRWIHICMFICLEACFHEPAKEKCRLIKVYQFRAPGSKVWREAGRWNAPGPQGRDCVAPSTLRLALVSTQSLHVAPSPLVLALLSPLDELVVFEWCSISVLTSNDTLKSIFSLCHQQLSLQSMQEVHSLHQNIDASVAVNSIMRARDSWKAVRFA